MAAPKLFTPITVGGLTLANRIVIAPMCQYSADDGCMNSWHAMHYGTLAQSGAGALTIEATAVEPIGRITPYCVGLYDDTTEAAMAAVLAGIRRWSSMPVLLQLNHAGRKASSDQPWRGGRQLPATHPASWQPVAPSAIPMIAGDRPSQPFEAADLARIREAFVASAKRAARLGLDGLQLHAAHGYLLHSFLSPLSNQRHDAYGGSLENRMRFPLEVFDAVRAVFPADKPVSMRISATDWIDGGWDLDSSIALAAALKARGCAAINVSSGGIDPRAAIPLSPGYQVPLARAIRAAVGLPVVAVGLITEADHAEAIVAQGDADMVGVARAMLFDPRWPWHMAARLGGKVAVSGPYMRAQPSRYRDLFTLAGADKSV